MLAWKTFRKALVVFFDAFEVVEREGFYDIFLGGRPISKLEVIGYVVRKESKKNKGKMEMFLWSKRILAV